MPPRIPPARIRGRSRWPPSRPAASRAWSLLVSASLCPSKTGIIRPRLERRARMAPCRSPTKRPAPAPSAPSPTATSADGPATPPTTIEWLLGPRAAGGARPRRRDRQADRGAARRRPLGDRARAAAGDAGDPHRDAPRRERDRRPRRGPAARRPQRRRGRRRLRLPLVRPRAGARRDRPRAAPARRLRPARQPLRHLGRLAAAGARRSPAAGSTAPATGRRNRNCASASPRSTTRPTSPSRSRSTGRR